MKKLLNNVLSAGVKDEHPPYLAKKIYVSNIVALFVTLIIAGPYIALSYFLFTPLTFIPVIAVLISPIVILLNYLGFNNISRLIIGFLPMFMAEVFVAYLVPPGGEQYFQMYIIAFGMAITPFLVFDIRERLYIGISIAVLLFTFMFASDWLNAKLISDLSPEIVIHGPIGPINIFLGVSFMIIGVLVLAYQNYRSEKKSQELIKEMDLQTEDVKNSENELKEKIKQIEENQIEEKKRNWATEGIAQVSTILRSEQNGQNLYDELSTYITKYLDANQCGLFLVEKDEDDKSAILQLQSCYAYDRKKFLDKHIEPGQGLIGQAYLEQSTIYLKDIPDGYTSITSGMGESTPNELLIVPLIVNEEVEGVFEFASFNAFERYQIEFLENLGETLAAFINVNRINERTKILLEDSQQQAEEMRSQEEEMRQNMEELSATQEEMARKEQEYVSQIKLLEKELATLKA